MRIGVRLFAIVRERAGRDRLELELPDGLSAAEAARAACEACGIGGLDQHVALAVNREHVEAATPLRDGDELALIPPVSGGEGALACGSAPRVHARISADAPSLDRLAALVADDRAGAIVTFSGVTREVERLEYEAYEEMAAPRLEALLRELAVEHELLAIAAEHRVGTVPLREPSVIVAASAAHRGEAFAGARAAIDRIKAELPIWKLEHDGERRAWVAGTALRSGADGDRASAREGER